VTASLLLGSVENAINAQTASLAISTSQVFEVTTSFAESGDGPFTGSFSSSLYSFLSGSFTGSSLGTFTGSLLGNVIGKCYWRFNRNCFNSRLSNYCLTYSWNILNSGFGYNSFPSKQCFNSFICRITGRVEFSGSFSGSFTGDGSLLTGSYTVANPGNNRILTSVDAVNGNAEANLSFDGSTLTVVGNINTGQGVTEIYLMNQNVRTSDNVSFLSITETSAERFKENIQSLESNPILNLRPVTFNWKETGASDIGLIAEEVNVHLPELVKKNEEGEVEGIKYSKLTSLLIDVVQKQQSQIEALQSEIKWIKNRL
jgi:hypothetical protein